MLYNIMPGLKNKLSTLQEENLLTPQYISSTRNIEKYYEEIFLMVYGNSIQEGSDKWIQANKKMQLYVLVYALAKGKISDSGFLRLQGDLEKLINELGTENLGKEEKLETILALFVEKILSNQGLLSQGEESGEESNENILTILGNILGVEKIRNILDRINNRNIGGKLGGLDFDQNVSEAKKSVRIDVKTILESSEYKNSENKPKYLYEHGVSYKRGIEKYYVKVREKCFRNNESDVEIEEKMQKFNIAYILCKYKFLDVKRSSGERYFEHLLSVLDLYLDNEKKPSFEGALIALLHDVVEDSDVDHETLAYLFGDVVADGVVSLSKPSVQQYLEEGSDEYKQVKGLVESGFLNQKGAISDDIEKKKKHGKLNQEEKTYLENYKKIHCKYKDQRNREYFENFLGQGLQDHLSSSDKRNISVKCYDRIHNVSTFLGFGIGNIDKIFEKIDETIQYFLPITEKHFPHIHIMLLYELDRVLSDLMLQLEGDEHISKGDYEKYRDLITGIQGELFLYKDISSQVNRLVQN